MIEYPGIIAAATTGRVDLLVSNLNGTPERRKLILFSDGYVDSEISFLVRRDRLSPRAPGEGAGVDGFWSDLEESFLRTFVVENRYTLILRGLWVTLTISIASALGGTALGFGICAMRRSKSPLASIPALVFIRAIQGTPIVVLLMILYYIVFGSVNISAILVAIIGFSINFAAYVSEMMRTGIAAVDRGSMKQRQPWASTGSRYSPGSRSRRRRATCCPCSRASSSPWSR